MMSFMNYYRKIVLTVFCFLLSLFSPQTFAESDHCVLLVYHRFTDDGPKSTSVSPELFRSHLSYFQANGFEVLPLDKVINALKTKNTLPDKCVSLTADDGYQSIYDNAYPLLKEFQMPMAVFVSTKAIDQHYSSIMSWAQLRQMSDLIDVYNHGVSHSHLVGKEPSVISVEITYAQKRLEHELGVTTKFFAYPYGEFDDATYGQLQALDYVGFGQQSGAIGVNSDWLNLPRFAMAGSYAKMRSFALKVNSLPMPIVSEQPKSMIINESDRPLLTLKFSRPMNANERYQFACFVAGQDNPEINWVGADKVTVRSVGPLSKGRSRYNCTVPSMHKGRYYWYSKLWLAKSD
jgi:peptidoglycan/xylan/chitin deacetylase (PgdA/CDA1 family)